MFTSSIENPSISSNKATVLQLTEKLVKSDAELKEALLSTYMAVLKQQELKKNTDLTNIALLELLDTVFSIPAIHAAIESDNTLEAIAIHLETFLANRWEKIKNTALAYNYCETLPMTHFCLTLARILCAEFPDRYSSIYKLLMPTLMNTTDLFFDTSLDELSLVQFILDEHHAYPLPLDILKRHCQSIAKNDSDLERDLASRNPYKKDKIAISQRELLLLAATSSEATRLYRAAIQLLELTTLGYSTTKSANVGDHLRALQAGLYEGSVAKQGAEFNAAAPASEAIVVFATYLETLPTDIKKRLFSLQPASDSGYKATYTVGYIWEILTKATPEASRALDCTEIQSKRLNAILMNPANSHFLFKSSIEMKLSNARFDYTASVSAFESFLSKQSVSLTRSQDNVVEDVMSVFRYQQKYNTDHIVMNQLILKLMRNKKYDTVRMLLSTDWKIALDSQDQEGYTALFFASMDANCPSDVFHLILQNSQSVINTASNAHDTPLLFAVFHGAKEKVELLLANTDCNLALANANNESPVAIAIWKNHPEIATLLIQRGVSSDERPTLLYNAVTNNQQFILKAIFEKYQTDNMSINQVVLRLMQEKKYNAIKLLLSFDWKISLDKQDDEGNTPLSLAAAYKSCSTDVFQLILNKSHSAINTLNKKNRTPLLRAVLHGSKEKVELLLANRRCNLELADSANLTPVTLAIINGHLNIAVLLIEKGAMTTQYDRLSLFYNDTTQNQQSILKTMTLNQPSILKTIFEKYQTDNMSINLQTDYRSINQLVLKLMQEKKYDAIKLLLLSSDWQISLNSQDYAGNTVLLLATTDSDCPTEVFQLILNNSQSAINTLNKNHETALLQAILHGQKEKVALLLANTECNVELRNSINETPLSVAFRTQYFDRDIVIALLDKIDKNTLIQCAKKLIKENRQSCLETTLAKLDSDDKKRDAMLKLFTRAIGKKAEDGGKYKLTYTEWSVLSEAKCELTDSGKIIIGNFSNNSGYQRDYAVGARYYSNFEVEMRHLLTTTLGLSIEEGCDFHQSIVFTKEASEKLILLGLAGSKPLLQLINREVAKEKQGFYSLLVKFFSPKETPSQDQENSVAPAPEVETYTILW